MADEAARELLEPLMLHYEVCKTYWYVTSGRRYADLAEEVLNGCWVSAWRDLHLRLKRSTCVEYAYLSAELRLRGLARPDHLITDDDREGAMMRLAEVVAYPEVERLLLDDLNRFRTTLAQPKH